MQIWTYKNDKWRKRNWYPFFSGKRGAEQISFAQLLIKSSKIKSHHWLVFTEEEEQCLFDFCKEYIGLRVMFFIPAIINTTFNENEIDRPLYFPVPKKGMKLISDSGYFEAIEFNRHNRPNQ
jgi:hypothetical protein